MIVTPFTVTVAAEEVRLLQLLVISTVYEPASAPVTFETVYVEDVALAIGEPNACFVAAHEFGHMALHSHQTPVLAKRAYKDHRFDPEWQADRFADYWLTPTEGVRQCRSANHVAAKFGVSDEMARRRFDEVKNQGIQGELF